jgi:hypothetical protein
MVHVVVFACRALGTEQQFQEAVDIGAPLRFRDLGESA